MQLEINKDTPLVSVIIPAFNAERFIAETIRSVIAQTYAQWELLIIDDGSTDKTREIITSYLSDPRIKYIFQANAGVSAARNKGIEMANGYYLAFLDADDLWAPNNLAVKMYAFTGNIFWIYGDTIKIDETAKEVGSEEAGTGDQMLDRILAWEGRSVPNICSNALIKKECFTEGLRFDPSISTAADVDFALCLASKYKGWKAEGIPVYYRILSTGMSRNIEVMEKDFLFVYAKAEKLNLFRSWAFKQKCFSNMYLILSGSWWVNGRNKIKGTWYLFRAMISYPPNMSKLIGKVFQS